MQSDYYNDWPPCHRICTQWPMSNHGSKGNRHMARLQSRSIVHRIHLDNDMLVRHLCHCRWFWKRSSHHWSSLGHKMGHFLLRTRKSDLSNLTAALVTIITCTILKARAAFEIPCPMFFNSANFVFTVFRLFTVNIFNLGNFTLYENFLNKECKTYRIWHHFIAVVHMVWYNRCGLHTIPDAGRVHTYLHYHTPSIPYIETLQFTVQ